MAFLFFKKSSRDIYNTDYINGVFLNLQHNASVFPVCDDIKYIFHHTWEKWISKCPSNLRIHGRIHDDVIKWSHFPRNWPFVRGIHQSLVYPTHKGQWRGALMFYLLCALLNNWVNNREAGDLRRHRANYDVIVTTWPIWFTHKIGNNHWDHQYYFACIHT